MVQMALERLEQRADRVSSTDERKAAMPVSKPSWSYSCGNHYAQPIVNSGSCIDPGQRIRVVKWQQRNRFR